MPPVNVTPEPDGAMPEPEDVMPEPEAHAKQELQSPLQSQPQSPLSRLQSTLPTDVVVAPLRRGQLNDAVITDVTTLFGELVTSGAALGWVEPPSKLAIATLLTRLLEDCGDGPSRVDASTILAKTPNGVVGIAYWRRYLRPTNRVQADLERLAVSPSWHRQGVGAVLLRACIETAHKAGVEQLTLDSRADNADAIHMWQRFGFVEYSRLTDFVAFGDRRFDKSLWVLDLR